MDYVELSKNATAKDRQVTLQVFRFFAYIHVYCILQAKKELGFLIRSCSVESAIGTSHCYKEQPPPLPPKRNEITLKTSSTVTDRKTECTSKPVLMPKDTDKNQLEKSEPVPNPVTYSRHDFSQLHSKLENSVLYARSQCPPHAEGRNQRQSPTLNHSPRDRKSNTSESSEHTDEVERAPRPLPAIPSKSKPENKSAHHPKKETCPKSSNWKGLVPSKDLGGPIQPSSGSLGECHTQGLSPYQKHSWGGPHLNEGKGKTTESPSPLGGHIQSGVSKLKSSQPPLLPGPKPQQDFLSQQTPYQKHSWGGPQLNEGKGKTTESPSPPGGHDQSGVSKLKSSQPPLLPGPKPQQDFLSQQTPYQKHSWGGPQLNEGKGKTTESPSPPGGHDQSSVSKLKSFQPPLPGPKPQKDFLSQQTPYQKHSWGGSDLNEGKGKTTESPSPTSGHNQSVISPYQKHSWGGPHLNEGTRKTTESPSPTSGHNQSVISPYQKHSWGGPHLNEGTRKTTESPSPTGGHNQSGLFNLKSSQPPLPGPKPQQTGSPIYESKEQTPQQPPIPIKTHVAQTEQKRKPLLPPPKLKNSKQFSPSLPVAEKPKVPSQDVDSSSDDDIDEYEQPSTFTSSISPIDIEESYDDTINVRIPGRIAQINPTPVSFQQPLLRPKLSLPNEKKQNTSQQLYTSHNPPSRPTQELIQPKKPLAPPTSKKPPHVPKKTEPLSESPLLHRWQKQSDNVTTKQSSGTNVGLLIEKMNKEIY